LIRSDVLSIKFDSPVLQLQGSHCPVQNKSHRTYPGPKKYFPRPCHSPQQLVNIDKQQLLTVYIQKRNSSIHTAMFITVTCSKEKRFETGRTNHEH